MKIEYPPRDDFLDCLRAAKTASLDFIVLITAGISPSGKIDELAIYLDECQRALKRGGLLFIQGRPDYLPEIGVYLDRSLRFKYWIAVESALHQPTTGYPSAHAGLLLFCKGERFALARLRFSHALCAHCGKTLRDWGGKAHLMNPDGAAASDVWKSLPVTNNYTRLSRPALDAILELAGSTTAHSDGDARHGPITGMVAPAESLNKTSLMVGDTTQVYLPGLQPAEFSRKNGKKTPPPGFVLWNTIHRGDALEILGYYPDNSIDLVFADPPYNLEKGYNSYHDELNREQYLDWCSSWLDEYIRILKPGGSLYVLNLPHWGMYHAAYLNRRLYFQNWIVWDALSEPRGKLMPAHYSLLFYTKHPTRFTFNLKDFAEIDSRQYCLRASCIRQRKAAGVDDKEPLTDIWSDIHRIKHRRDRDYHPCQLPDALLERIIKISSNPGDIVLDALVGVGTTAVVAARLGRQYVGIDIDEEYVRITRQKLDQVQQYGQISRPSLAKSQLQYTKKELQLELRRLARLLGRLPTQEDVRLLSVYRLETFLQTFPTWGKALKAAKLEIDHGSAKDIFSGSLG